MIKTLSLIFFFIILILGQWLWFSNKDYMKLENQKEFTIHILQITEKLQKKISEELIIFGKVSNLKKIMIAI